MLAKEGRLPDIVMACVGGGSNAMGLFYDFMYEFIFLLIFHVCLYFFLFLKDTT